MTEHWFYDAERRVVFDENRIMVAQDVGPQDGPVIAGAPQLLSAAKGVLPFAEAAEDKALVGDEGCLWPVEAIRSAVKEVEAPEAQPAQPNPPLFAILADMLAYEAEQFDAEPVFDLWEEREDGDHKIRDGIDAAEVERLKAANPGTKYYTVEFERGDLDLSGADLVDAFTEWRAQIKAALAAARPAQSIIAAGDAMHAMIGEALQVHIYDHDDAIPVDDNYVQAQRAWEAAKAGQAEPRTIYIEIEGGMISGLTAADGAADLRFVVIDHDTDTGHQSEVAHEVLNDDGDWEEVILTEVTATQAPPPETREITLDENERETRKAEADQMFPRPSVVAGYTVEPNGFAAGGYYASDPEGEEIHPGEAGKPFRTARAAWEACDAHLRSKTA